MSGSRKDMVVMMNAIPTVSYACVYSLIRFPLSCHTGLKHLGEWSL